ncbi:MAG: hypothetical protein ACFE8E_02655 [Candidatus Hodarchaeota archaeon]
METKDAIKEREFNAKPFKIVYIFMFAFILIFDVIMIVLLFTVWANLATIVYVFIEALPFGMIFYLLFLVSPVVKVGFEIYELVRFSRFLKSSNQSKESAIDVSRGFKGTRIYRIYYLVILVCFIIWMEIFDFQSKFLTSSDPDISYRYLTFSRFYWWFAILLFIHILPIIIGPEIIKFSTDYSNRKKLIKMILGIILWTILLILLLNIDFFIALIVLIIAKINSP